MANSYLVRQPISFDLAAKDYVTVDVGTSATPQVYQLPVFKNNTQIKLINKTNNIYCPAGYNYSDLYSQTWNNAPNVITIFIQDAALINVRKEISESTGKISYSTYPITYSTRTSDSETVGKKINDYFFTNAGATITTGGNPPSMKSATSLQNINLNTSYTPSSYAIFKGNETSGTLSNLFKRPDDEDMNPTGLNNIAQGNYPYQNNNIIQGVNIDYWVGSWNQIFSDATGSPGDPDTTYNVNFPGFDYSSGSYIDVYNINNIPFGVIGSNTTTKIVSLPPFFEPIDYYIVCQSKNSIFCLYRRVYFGIQPFNYTPKDGVK